MIEFIKAIILTSSSVELFPPSDLCELPTDELSEVLYALVWSQIQPRCVAVVLVVAGGKGTSFKKGEKLRVVFSAPGG